MIRIVNAYTDTHYGSAPDVKSAEQFMRNNLLKHASVESHNRIEKDVIFVYDACGTKFFEIGYGS